MNTETVWLDVIQKNETEKAFLFSVNGVDTWIPKSAVGGRKKQEGLIVRCEIKRWLAEKVKPSAGLRRRTPLLSSRKSKPNRNQP